MKPSLKHLSYEIQIFVTIPKVADTRVHIVSYVIGSNHGDITDLRLWQRLFINKIPLDVISSITKPLFAHLFTFTDKSYSVF